MLRAIVGTLVAVLLTGTAEAQLTKAGEPVTINWYHGAQALRPVIAEYMRETGRKVIVNDDYDTFTTDVMMVSDYKGLTEGKKFGHFQPLASEAIEAAVPARWRDRDGYWTGVVLRTRAPVFNKDLVTGKDIPRTWFDLADPKWRGKITLRASSNVYNRSLVAWMIHHYGAAKARAWVRGVLANAGPDPKFVGDVANSGLVGRGAFPLAFINTYYMGYVDSGAMTGQATQAELEKVGIAWMDKSGPGQPVNVTGAAIHSSTENGDHARLLIEWLVSKRGQELLTQHVFKYPVRADVKPSAYLQRFGSFRPDLLDLNKLEFRYDEADRILRESGWKADW
jgi:iron(III) transport system substrate-binding protein